MKLPLQRGSDCGSAALLPVLFVFAILVSSFGYDVRWFVLGADVCGIQNRVLGYYHEGGPSGFIVRAEERDDRQPIKINGLCGGSHEALAFRHRALSRRFPQRSVTPPPLPSRGLHAAATHYGTRRQQLNLPLPAPRESPSVSTPAEPHSLPTPPPHSECVCADGYTTTPTGSPCGCVIPIQVGLELGVDLDTLFPQVIELAKELADGSFLQQSQVRITGANAVSDDQTKTDVHADLVPLGVAFDNTTVQLIAQRFWTKQVVINETLFGNYSILYVKYPGLPPSPPAQSSGPASGRASPGSTRNGTDDTGKGEPGSSSDKKFSRGLVAIISLTSIATTVIFFGALWLVIMKCGRRESTAVVEPTYTSGVRKSGTSTLMSTVDISTSLSFSSSFATYTGSGARAFSLIELERATNNFNPENIVGEGGFGRVYEGHLDDGLRIAVKVLTRDDEQGDREYLAEAELLSRLHHRNLVKLLGICAEDRFRSLVYELISNGSVESHLHGPDAVNPLNWDARLKIALGAARGLAYLHEDSNPRVIHRDFKASNILLEEDFTPKISDFGLAKVASEGGGDHISTRVMGTFGYVAPEYAMTGHLLVKSDVYSYGVVLLELLSGRKPVDMSPHGQGNLVTWARPLLTTNEGLDLLLDPVLGDSVPFDHVARVAAIASMCVQPEVSHRPFMGEVVQALKLVYNDSDASDGRGSMNGSHTGDLCMGTGDPLGPQSFHRPNSEPTGDFNSGPTQSCDFEPARPLSASAVLSQSSRFIRQLSGSFRRHSNSGPLRTTRSKPAWYKVRNPRGGTVSDHRRSKFEIELERDYFELWP